MKKECARIEEIKAKIEVMKNTPNSHEVTCDGEKIFVTTDEVGNQKVLGSHSKMINEMCQHRRVCNCKEK